MGAAGARATRFALRGSGWTWKELYTHAHAGRRLAQLSSSSRAGFARRACLRSGFRPWTRPWASSWACFCPQTPARAPPRAALRAASRSPSAPPPPGWRVARARVCFVAPCVSPDACSSPRFPRARPPARPARVRVPPAGPTAQAPARARARVRVRAPTSARAPPTHALVQPRFLPEAAAHGDAGRRGGRRPWGPADLSGPLEGSLPRALPGGRPVARWTRGAGRCWRGSLRWSGRC